MGLAVLATFVRGAHVRRARALAWCQCTGKVQPYPWQVAVPARVQSRIVMLGDFSTSDNPCEMLTDADRCWQYLTSGICYSEQHFLEGIADVRAHARRSRLRFDVHVGAPGRDYHCWHNQHAPRRSRRDTFPSTHDLLSLTPPYGLPFGRFPSLK